MCVCVCVCVSECMKVCICVCTIVNVVYACVLLHSNPPLSREMLPPGDWMCHRCAVRRKVSLSLSCFFVF